MQGECQCGENHDGSAKKLGENFPPKSPNSPTTRPKAKIVATYDYHDEAGTLLFQVCRFDPKDFRQRRPDGKGGWIWGLGDTRRVLYRLPDVLEGIAVGKTVFVVEGEKDVEAIEKAGGVATCNPMGAGKWNDDYSALLAGATIHLIQDKDDAGKRHCEAVQASLEAAGCTVTVREAREGKDAADHLAAGGTLEDFPAVGTTDVQRKIATLTALLSNGKTSAARFFASQPEPQRWVFEGMIQKGVVGLTVAAGGTGKGFLTLYMAVKAALGHPFCGFRPPRPQSVLLLGWEDAENTLHQRFLDTVQQEYPYLTADEQERLSSLEIWPVVGDGYHLDHLVEVLSASRRRDLIILDPLKLFLPPKMSITDDEDGAELHRRLNQIVAAHNHDTTINVCHHVPKYLQIAGQQLTQAAAGGAASIVDLGRFSINARKIDKAEIKKLGLDPKEAYLEVAIPKQNYAPELPERVTFRRGKGGALIEERLPAQVEVDIATLLEGLREIGLPTRMKTAESHLGDARRDDEDRLPQKRFHKALRAAEERGLLTVVTLDGKGAPKEIREPISGSSDHYWHR
jgi:RecA-family ATPase/5S rRNA maturation endonuclease (ribonuclease M5)